MCLNKFKIKFDFYSSPNFFRKREQVREKERGKTLLIGFGAKSQTWHNGSGGRRMMVAGDKRKALSKVGNMNGDGVGLVYRWTY